MSFDNTKQVRINELEYSGSKMEIKYLKEELGAGQMTCKHCGGSMRKNTRSFGNFVGIIGALLLFVLGVFIFFAFMLTIIGAIIGLLLILMSLGMGGKRQKIWKCTNCGYYFKRA